VGKDKREYVVCAMQCSLCYSHTQELLKKEFGYGETRTRISQTGEPRRIAIVAVVCCRSWLSQLVVAIDIRSGCLTIRPHTLEMRD
jgi:hypothetical protein